MHKPDPRARAWAEIDLGALARNYRRLREQAGGRELIPVVKADAYGHGAPAVGRRLVDEGAKLLAVVTLDEACALRESGVEAELLVLGPLLQLGEAERAVHADLQLVATRAGALDVLEAAAQRVGRAARVHLKLDTGMGRLGLAPDELDAAMVRLVASRSLELTGLMTHLAEADDPDSPSTAAQRARFGEALERVRAADLAPEWIHIDNSAGIARGCWEGANAARPGIALYGADPTQERSQQLEPVMSLYARVCHAKTVPAGARIGYGGDYVAPREVGILTVTLGYADGFPRSARGWCVGLGERRLPLAGRVSCDLLCVEGPRGGDEVGREVLVFGRSGELELPVEQLAECAGTIAYEILVGIGPRIPRVYRG